MTSRSFAVWNLLGILDLVVAVSIGAINTSLATGAPGEITVAPMAQMPLVLIPAYLVPLFVMLHLAALFQARRPALSNHQRRPPVIFQRCEVGRDKSAHTLCDGWF